MSRKMIDYQVENGKISTIDGYNVGGGGAKYEIVHNYKSAYLAIPVGDYTIGQKLSVSNPIYTNDNIVSATLSPSVPPVKVAGTAVFIATTPIAITAQGSASYLILTCIQSGTVSTKDAFRADVYTYYLNEQAS